MGVGIGISWGNLMWMMKEIILYNAECVLYDREGMGELN